MANLPTGANQTVLYGAFITFYLNQRQVASGTSLDWGMQYQGDWLQTFGTDRPTRNPNTKWGRGTLDRVRIYGNSIYDILIATGQATAASLASGGIDLRITPFTGTVRYNDGTKTVVTTLVETYILEDRKKVEGNRLTMNNVPFEYAYETEV